MRKFLITLLITISLSGLIFPVASHAATKTTNLHLQNGDKSTDIDVSKMTPAEANAAVANWLKSTGASDSAAKDVADKVAANIVADDTCGMFSLDVCIVHAFYEVAYFIGNIILSAVAWILWACGIMLNLSIIVFVVNMKSQIAHIPAIFAIWTTTRDLANMFFIFILLAIAIQTILQTGGSYKTMLRNVILIALFINFSFFITGALIDASNIMALQFYNGFAGTSCDDGSNSVQNTANKADGCMSQKVVNALRLGTVYDSAPKAGAASSTPGLAAKKSQGYDPKSLYSFYITVIFGSVLMIVTAGVFIASAMLIFFRFVQLIIVLMFSPIAFAAWILPSTKKYWTQWWDKLITQLIFAPVYFMFIWMVMKAISMGGLRAPGEFDNAFAGNAQAFFGLIASYIIIIMLMSYSLVLAKELGASGAETATKAAKGFQGFVGRNTVGRASSRIANSQAMQKLVSTVPFAGRLAQKPFDSLAKQSWGGKKGGFDQAEKDAIKDKAEQAKRLGPSVLMTEKTRIAKEVAEENLKNNPDSQNAKDAAAKARDEHDIMVGIDKDEVQKRALKTQKNEKQIHDRALEMWVDNGGKGTADEMVQHARDEDALNVQKTADALTKKYKGVAKTRQEKYAASNERNYAAIGSNVTGVKGKLLRTVVRPVGGLVNLVTNHTTRVSESAGIRKTVTKEKTDIDKIADAVRDRVSGDDKKKDDEKKDKDKK